jgi:hypothetical protein
LYKGDGSDCEQKEIPVQQGFALIFHIPGSFPAGGIGPSKTATPPFSDCSNIAKKTLTNVIRFHHLSPDRAKH